MNLKKLLHNSVFRRAYYHIFTDQQIRPKINGERRVYLFGMPQYLNYGDIAIYVAEIEFLNKYLPSFDVISIPERFMVKKIPIVNEIIEDNDIIAFQGGGNMGDIWPYHDRIRQKVIDAFGSRYRIISFPQSIAFNNPAWPSKTYKLLKKCKDISIFAREKASYEKMKDIFPHNVKCFLVPDIAMSLDKTQDKGFADEVLFLLRKDKEKLYNPNINKVKDYVNDKYKCKYSDTVDDIWHRIDEKTAEKRLDDKLKEFRKAKLVITDRLHGMIFSYITGTPALVFDNNNHKIKNSYNLWLKDLDSIFLDNGDQESIFQFIDNAMNSKIPIRKINLDYSPLINEFLRSN